jgi:hypothetical protein
MVIMVCLHHQQMDNCCEIQHENAKGFESLFTCGAALRFTPTAPPEKLFEPLLSCCGGPHNDEDDEYGCGGGIGCYGRISSSSS